MVATEARRVEIPRLLRADEGSLDEIPTLLAEHAFGIERIYVGSGAGASGPLAASVVAALAERGCEVGHRVELTGFFEQAVSLAEEVQRAGASTLLAVGGGRVIDTVKIAAARTGTPFVSVPTTISHDGISSPVASLIGEDGQRRSYAATMPAGIVVDIRVIGSAPPRTLRAGMGDLVSNLTAILDWRLADRAGRDRFDAYSAMIAESAARSVLSLEDLSSPASHEHLARGLLMSGLAMAAAGTSRPCSGAEHLISHALDEASDEGLAMHGEQVALGSLISAAAHGSDLLQQLTSLYSRLGLPTHPAHLSISEAAIVRAVQAAPATRPDRYTILSERALDDAAVGALLESAFADSA